MHGVVRRLVSRRKISCFDVGVLLSHNEYLSANFDVLGFITKELGCGLKEGDIPEFYFSVLAGFPFKKRMEAYIELLSKDPEGKLLAILPFESSSYVGSGKEGFVPAYSAEIEIVKSISNSLPRDACFAYHRKCLAKIVRAKECEIEKERWRSFHESI